MRYVKNAIITFFLTSVIAGSGFAASDPVTFSEPAVVVEKHAVKPRPRRRARRLTTIPYLKNSVKEIRVRRLSARERRDVYRRLIDIRIN
jgi:hypothetical protein